MIKDRKDGSVTIGEIEEVIFKLKSGKTARAYPCYESWIQSGDIYIDSDVLDATFGALRESGYISEDA